MLTHLKLRFYIGNTSVKVALLRLRTLLNLRRRLFDRFRLCFFSLNSIFKCRDSGVKPLKSHMLYGLFRIFVNVSLQFFVGKGCF
jgi:hypothetical protein